MEPLGANWTRKLMGLAALLMFAGAGCIGTEPFTLSVNPPDRPPTGVPCQVVVMWDHHVMSTPDTYNGGNAVPAIAGRLFLFDQQVHSLAADGSLVISLFDDTAAVPGKGSPLVQEWRLDKDNMKQLLRKDMVGWGYTVVLPWWGYKPETTRVRIKVCWQPVKGTPLYTECGPITLDSGPAPRVTMTTTTGAQQALKPTAPLQTTTIQQPAPTVR